MLEIKNIVKDYATGSETVHALRDVSIRFRESELVAVLGHSGCGKTTLLNIIGGLDSYTSGDLVINGKSTKKFKSRDWDTYRNHSVGFIFQSYNLIPHQNVLSNVELALTLSGVSKSERKKRAKEALEKVGLGDQLNKRPNQMSGGQMQRVAIARALVNDPDILLADEPTGALDSETSVQIMELIKEIASDRLVIMVTHNPELAQQYATRIVKLVDGKIKSDSNPFDGEEKVQEKKQKGSKKTSMSFATALALSRNNLLTKKGRTFLTSFAGSIGIIGIALILSLSNGVQNYIDSVEHSTLASYPISIQQETMDYTKLMESMMGQNEKNVEERDPNLVYTNDISTEMVKSMLSEIKTNNLKDFKEYIESDPENILDSITEIQYSYSPKLYIYGKDLNDNVLRMNPSTVMEAMLGKEMSANVAQMGGTYSTIFGGGGEMSSTNFWSELLNSKTTEEQYEILAGRLPESYNEVVFIVNKNNELSDLALYSLGFRDQKELSDMMAKFMAGESIDIDTGDMTFTYEQLMSKTFRLLTVSDMYKANDKGGYDDMTADKDYMNAILEKAPEIKVVGVIRPNGDSLISSTNSGGIGYTHALTEYMIERTRESELMKKQLENPKVDVFTGIEFTVDGVEKKPMTQEEAFEKIMQMLSAEQQQKLGEALAASLSQEQLAQLAQLPPEQQQTAVIGMSTPSAISGAMMKILTADQISELMKLTQEPETTEATYDGNLEKLGLADLSEPSSISIYAKDFDGKEKITKLINDYNERKTAEEKTEDVINYTDYIGLMISSVSTIIDSISYILIAFVAISLVVSSIMIGIITYISVLERTKEIGILRAIGASKRDVSNVFNAETLIVGFSAGAIGIIATVILNIPINIIIEHLTDISGMSQLPWQGAVILVIISMLLTLIAGLFPARIASKKDPVEALRTE